MHMLASSVHGFSLNFVLLVLRVYLGAMIMSHGYFKIFRGGKLAGTGAWFDSIGMKPGRLHATMAAFTEIGVGALLIAGLLTSFAAAGLIALMIVAMWTVHVKNGFFVFHPGQGVEYCLMIAVAALVPGTFGAGRYSLDNLFLHPHFLTKPSHALAITLILGIGGAALQLLVFFRPPSEKTS